MDEIRNIARQAVIDGDFAALKDLAQRFTGQVGTGGGWQRVTAERLLQRATR